MRIVHVAQSLAPEGGGVPVAAAGLALGQAKLGHRVTLLGGVPEDAPERTVLRGLPEPASSFDLEAVAERPGSLAARTALGFRAPLARLLQEADVLHLHGVWEPAVLRAARRAHAARVPFVLCSHGMWAPWSLERRWLKKRVAWGLVYARAFRHAAALHCLTEDEERFSVARGLGVRCVRLPNGIDLDALPEQPDVAAFRARCPGLGERRFFLFLGRFHAGKGLDLLADAFVDFARGGGEWDLVLLGPDPADGSLADFRHRIGVAHQEARVHVLAPAYGPEKYAALMAAGALVQPSRQEAFSLSIAEAMACARPVVISGACQFDEVRDVGAGIVTELDAHPVTDALFEVARDEASRERMGRAGRALVERKYTWRGIAESATAFYATLPKPRER